MARQRNRVIEILQHSACLLFRGWLTPLRIIPKAVEPELKFRAPVPRIQNFWLRLQPLKVLGSGARTIWSSANKKTLYYLYNSLAQETMFVKPGTKFQAPAPHPWLYHLKIQAVQESRRTSHVLLFSTNPPKQSDGTLGSDLKISLQQMAGTCSSHCSVKSSAICFKPVLQSFALLIPANQAFG